MGHQEKLIDRLREWDGHIHFLQCSINLITPKHLHWKIDCHRKGKLYMRTKHEPIKVLVMKQIKFVLCGCFHVGAQ